MSDGGIGQQYEQRISGDELQRRWEDLWTDYDADAPGDGWDVPGPWNTIEDRLEARILADELDLPRPDDPMFDAEATRPIPRGFGGIRRGADVPAGLDRPFRRMDIQLPYLFDKLQIGVGNEEGRVRDVLVGSFYNSQQGTRGTTRGTTRGDEGTRGTVSTSQLSEGEGDGTRGEGDGFNFSTFGGRGGRARGTVSTSQLSE